MRTKTISFTFAYQYADYDELVKDIIEKMFNVGLEMAKGKNMAICYEGESEKKEADNDYAKVMHVIAEKRNGAACEYKLNDKWKSADCPIYAVNDNVSLIYKEKE
jgi:hypothetical protein